MSTCLLFLVAQEIGSYVPAMIAAAADPLTLCVLGACVVALLRGGCGVADVGGALAALRVKVCLCLHLYTYMCLRLSVHDRGCSVYVVTLCHSVTSQCPKAYLETSHGLASIVNPSRPVLAGPVLGGGAPSGLRPLWSGSDHVQGPTLVPNDGTGSQDSALPWPKAVTSAPPPQTTAFPHLIPSDLTTPFNGRNR